MLTREIMGALALAILWVNTLLIAAVALKQVNEQRRRARSLRPLAPGEEGHGLVAARIQEGDGPEGALARYELEQLGRAGVEDHGRRTIHFGDRSFSSAVLGGVIVADGARVRMKAGEGEVWPAREDVLAAAGCDDRARFDRAFDEARKARGHARTVRVDLRAGSSVWVAGELRRAGDEWQLASSDRVGLLVSAIDPRAALRKRAALALVFAIGEVAAAAGVTALVLVPPVFDGWPSKIGGLLGLAFFLAVQPLGNAVRDAVRAPGRLFVRGRWVEPAASAGRERAGEAALGADHPRTSATV